jgi:regulator of chromosome condensation
LIRSFDRINYLPSKVIPIKIKSTGKYFGYKPKVAGDIQRDTRVSLKMTISPAQTRKRAASADSENQTDQPRKREKLDNPTTFVTTVTKQLFNPIPSPPTPTRPARQLFIFGNGDSNQFGLGPDTFGDIVRPRLHAWVEEAVKEGRLGAEPGAGIESVSAGGMHTLMVDEAGKVSSSFHF